MLRKFIISFVLLSLAGCAGLHDGMERLGMKNEDFHSLPIEEALNHLADKTILVTGYSSSVIYFSPTQKAYFWGAGFIAVTEVNWKLERQAGSDRYRLCFEVPFLRNPTGTYPSNLLLRGFFILDARKNYSFECGDYNYLAAASIGSEKSDIFNLSSKETPPANVMTWYGETKTLSALKKEIAEAKRKSQ